MSHEIPKTLLELLDAFKVEVPIVQRDYAQGRQDEHAKMVRLNLLKDMKAAILEETSPLDLNFVYGKAESDKFIPLDGQQRLTTLYLLHIYAFYNDSSKTDILNKFTYETRKSSRDFFEKLNQNRATIFTSSLIPSKEIEDREWFVSSWKYDPTIQGTLTMLDDICNVFCDVDNLAQKLSSQESQPIVFNFLDIGDLGMEDSLYIKLNARGKPLTEFENFKARLIGRIEKLQLDYEDKFKQSFDCEWTDIFWENSKGEFDITYLNFFGVLLMNNHICHTDINWSNSIDYEKIDKDIYEMISYTLNFLCNNPEQELARTLILNGLMRKRTYQDRILFHAVTTYLHMAKGINTGSLTQWLRIIKNLTLNSQIDTLPLYHRAIDGINGFLDSWDNLIEYFSQGGHVVGFSTEQIEEERIKARIILQNQNFAEAIYKAEQHQYFNGQIRSGLYYSQDSDGNYNDEVFVQYWDKISALFEETKSKHGDLLRRALLSMGDYTLPVGSYKTLCVDDANESASTPSLKRLFSNHGVIVKQLLDMLNIDEDIELQLKNIITSSHITQDDWRYCLLEYPFLFKWMSTSHLRLRQTGAGMLIIPNKSSNGYNYDIFLATLYGLLIRKGLEVRFGGDMGAWADRYLCVKDVYIRFRGSKYIFENINNIIIFETNTNTPITEAERYININ